jgi:hypothetical protein
MIRRLIPTSDECPTLNRTARRRSAQESTEILWSLVAAAKQENSHADRMHSNKLRPAHAAQRAKKNAGVHAALFCFPLPHRYAEAVLGAQRRLIARWSCSTILLRYRRLRISTDCQSGFSWRSTHNAR